MVDFLGWQIKRTRAIRAYTHKWKSPNPDEDRPTLEFAIIGFAKCGTTSMEGNLHQLAPMPVADICTPLAQTVYYSYANWVDQFDPSVHIYVSNLWERCHA